MRRPLVRRARRQFPNLFPAGARERIWENIKAQDRWAMKHGKALLAFSINLLILSVILSTAFVGFLELYTRGMLPFVENDPSSPAKIAPKGAAPQ